MTIQINTVKLELGHRIGIVLYMAGLWLVPPVAIRKRDDLVRRMLEHSKSKNLLFGKSTKLIYLRN